MSVLLQEIRGPCAHLPGTSYDGDLLGFGRDGKGRFDIDGLFDEGLGDCGHDLFAEACRGTDVHISGYYLLLDSRVPHGKIMLPLVFTDLFGQSGAFGDKPDDLLIPLADFVSQGV